MLVCLSFVARFSCDLEVVVVGVVEGVNIVDVDEELNLEFEVSRCCLSCP